MSSTDDISVASIFLVPFDQPSDREVKSQSRILVPIPNRKWEM